MLSRMNRNARLPNGIVRILALAFFATVTRSFADIGPANTAILINGDSWASKSIANEYIALRNIPISNVIVLHDIPDFESVSVDVFRDKILQPAFEKLKSRGVWDQIDCLAYSSDFPWSIDAKGDLGGKKTTFVNGPTGSINGLTYLHELVIAKDVSYLDLASNAYMRLPTNGKTPTAITADELAEYQAAVQVMLAKDWQAAVDKLKPIAEKHPDRAELLYNLACCESRLGKKEDAIASLQKAVDAGWMDRNHMKSDSDLAALRDMPAFVKLLESMASKTFTTQPTVGFRSQKSWTASGPKGSGLERRYLLSTMLAVTSGRGNSVSEAMAYLRRSAAADSTAPNGTFYYCVNKDVRSTTRAPAFPSAVEELTKAGAKAQIIESPLPANKKDVAGAMIGIAGFDWKKSGSTIAPGAICEHLTSFGGIMKPGAGQTPLSEFLRYGAAGSSGTVMEPLALQAKFPTPFLHVHYFRGSTLAEAFYQSVHGPYQLLIVGDPLCKPWAPSIQLDIAGLSPDQVVKGAVEITPQAVVRAAGSGKTANDASSAITNASMKRFELYLDGVRTKTCQAGQSLSFDAAELADGYHEARVVAVLDHPLEFQGTQIIPFLVDNHGQKASIEILPKTSASWNEKVTIRVEAKGASSVSLMWNGQKIGSEDADTAEWEDAPSRFGFGPVSLYAIASFGDKTVRSKPVSIQVNAGEGLRALSSTSAGLANGLSLTRKGSKPQFVRDTKSNDWLKSMALKSGDRFRVEGFFSVAKQDIYQFQLRTDAKFQLSVDGQMIHRPRKSDPESAEWHYLPVVLQPGQHRFDANFTLGKSNSLPIRFGSTPVSPLDETTFKHAK